MLISSQEFNALKSRDLVPLQCEYCDRTFHKPKNYIQQCFVCDRKKADYCSYKCARTAYKKATIVTCLNCLKEFEKAANQIKKSPNHFCCRSCRTTYCNKHKSTGTRRAKLEVYIEDQLTSCYPSLPCLFNDHSIIGSELDFYFPTLKLAIELNGIFHYEPIYGQDKLERIQENDKQKGILCYQLGIEFCTVDTSTCKYLTQKEKDKYWAIINGIVSNILERNK